MTEFCRPDRFDTRYANTVWLCLRCEKPVPAEHIGPGRYAPASRYWHLNGVLCSVECPLAYHTEHPP